MAKGFDRSYFSSLSKTLLVTTGKKNLKPTLDSESFLRIFMQCNEYKYHLFWSIHSDSTAFVLIRTTGIPNGLINLYAVRSNEREIIISAIILGNKVVSAKNCTLQIFDFVLIWNNVETSQF